MRDDVGSKNKKNGGRTTQYAQYAHSVLLRTPLPHTTLHAHTTTIHLLKGATTQMRHSPENQHTHNTAHTHTYNCPANHEGTAGSTPRHTGIQL